MITALKRFYKKIFPDAPVVYPRLIWNSATQGTYVKPENRFTKGGMAALPQWQRRQLFWGLFKHQSLRLKAISLWRYAIGRVKRVFR